MFAYEDIGDPDLGAGTEPTDPVGEVDTSLDTGTTDYKGDASAAMSGLTDVIGSQEGILLLAAIVGAVVIGYKTNAFDKIAKSIKKKLP